MAKNVICEFAAAGVHFSAAVFTYGGFVMFMLPMPKFHERAKGDFVFGEKLFVTLPQGILDKTSADCFCELVSGYTAGRTKAEFVISEKLSGSAVISEKPYDGILSISTENDYELHCGTESIKLVFSDRLGFAHSFVSFFSLSVLSGQGRV